MSRPTPELFEQAVSADPAPKASMDLRRLRRALSILEYMALSLCWILKGKNKKFHFEDCFRSRPIRGTYRTRAVEDLGFVFERRLVLIHLHLVDLVVILDAGTTNQGQTLASEKKGRSGVAIHEFVLDLSNRRKQYGI